MVATAAAAGSNFMCDRVPPVTLKLGLRVPRNADRVPCRRTHLLALFERAC